MKEKKSNGHLRKGGTWYPSDFQFPSLDAREKDIGSSAPSLPLLSPPLLLSDLEEAIE